MLRIIPITAMLACGAVLTGCAADTMTPGQEPADNRAGQADTPQQVFMLRVDSGMTAETITPALLASAHDSLVAACEATPDKAVRVFNPLASGVYVDVPCSALLADDEATGRRAGCLPVVRATGRSGKLSKDRTHQLPDVRSFLGGSTLFLDKVMCPVRRRSKIEGTVAISGSAAGSPSASCAASRSDVVRSTPWKSP